RPPIANVDIGVIVSSVIHPSFSAQLLDRFLVMLEYKHIDPIIYISKLDQADEQTIKQIKQYKEIYEKIGYPFITLNVAKVENLKEEMKNIFTNSSHVSISYAVFCLKKKNMINK